jgi:hypothetical protein
MLPSYPILTTKARDKLEPCAEFIDIPLKPRDGISSRLGEIRLLTLRSNKLVVVKAPFLKPAGNGWEEGSRDSVLFSYPKGFLAWVTEPVVAAVLSIKICLEKGNGVVAKTGADVLPGLPELRIKG